MILTGAFVLFCSVWVCADMVTLNSGDVMEGRIISETDDQIEMEVAEFRGTILTKKTIAKADVKSVVREDIAVKQERAAYAALAKFTLNPNQELGKDQYAAGIAAFQNFLAKYPKSESASNVAAWVVDWRAESSHVASGQVKFARKWMTPDEKKVLAEQAQKDAERQAAEGAVNASKAQIATLLTQRGPLLDAMSAVQLKLSAAQAKLASIEKSQSSPGTTAVGADRPGMAGQLTQRIKVPDQTLPPEHPAPAPDTSALKAEIAGYELQMSQGQAALATIDGKIKDLQAQLPKLEQEAKPAEPAAAKNPEKSAAKAVEKPPEPPGPWYSRLWKWISSFWH